MTNQKIQQNHIEFIEDNRVIVTNTYNTKFDFNLDKIFHELCSQEDFYTDCSLNTISDFINGYNGTIFAYGQSGSGKTFTMYGDDILNSEKKGIIPRTM